jgi:serine/threonine protein kinase/Tol biopolymer transport system component
MTINKISRDLAKGTLIAAKYRILTKIGAGGMGEVYRAEDLNLNRQVAIKMLPDVFAKDEERLARFQREAKVLAALNHPNIAAIYGVEEAEGKGFLVLELVEGETLAERLRKGPLPLEEALEVCRQIAEGLEGAHEKSIIHRDLKPSNVKITLEGKVKILDFGLARAFHDQISEVDNIKSPTITADMTQPGVILGTAAYMSPEQAKGKSMDKRTDIWSFGCILYECLTGKRAFGGETVTETIAAILKSDPDWSSIPSATPAAAQSLLRRCLKKDPHLRLRDLGDARLEIAEVLEHPVSPAVPLAPPRASWWSRFAFFLVGALLVAAIAFIITRRSVHPQPTFHKLSFGRGSIGNARFTPDGNSILYNARWEDRANELFTTRVDAPGVTPLEIHDASVIGIRGGEAAVLLGTAAAGISKTLATIPIGGGSSRPVLESVMAADWSPDGKSLAVVRPVSGGQRLEYPLGKVLFETAGWIGDVRISPRGDRVAFAHWPATGDVSGSVLVIDSEGRVKTLSEGWFGVQSLAWSQDGSEVWFGAGKYWGWYSLYAVSLAGKLRTVLETPASLILHEIFRDGRVLLASGTLTNELWGRAQGDATERSFSWLDGTGAFGLSADGTSLLFSEVSVGGGISRAVYLRYLDGSSPVRIGEGRARGLSPDGAWALSTVQIPKPALFLIPTGAGETRALPLGSIARYHWASFFPDGKRVLIVGNEEGRPQRLFVQDVAGGPPRPITVEGVRVPEPSSCVSPDGAQVAAFATEGGPVLVSVSGGELRPIEGLLPGEQPIAWTRDGKSLFVAEYAPGVKIGLRIVRFDLASRKRALWKELRPADPAGARIAYMPVIAQDGDVYFYTVLRGLNNLYLVEGLR